MRSSIATPCKRALSSLFALILAFGLVPTVAIAHEGDGSVVADDHQAASDGSEAGVSTSDESASAAALTGDIINQELSLSTVAQAESTRSFFLARTLESTRDVPMVSAKLPVEADSPDQTAEPEKGDGAETSEGGGDPTGSSAEGVSADSTVIGSFICRGITYAIEPGGESVAIVAADLAKLPQDLLDAQTIVLPTVVSPDGIDFFSVTRIADEAFSSLTAVPGEATETEEGGTVLAAEPSDPADISLASDSDDGADDDEEETASDSADADVADVVVADSREALGSAIDEEPSASIIAITVPASITVIEENAFSGFETLQYVVVSADNPNYAMYDACLYDKALNSLLLIPEGRLGAVRIPSSVTAEGLDPDAFSHCASVDALVVEADSAAYQLLEGEDIHKSNDETMKVTDDPSSVSARANLDVMNYSQVLSIDDAGSLDLLEELGVERDDVRRSAFATSADALFVDSSGFAMAAENGTFEVVAITSESGSEPPCLSAVSIVASGFERMEDEGAAMTSSPSETSERAVALAEDGAAHSLAIEGGLIQLRLGNRPYWFLSGAAGTTDAVVTWTGGTEAAPAEGSIVNVHVTRYEGTGPEAMRGVLTGMSIRAWGANGNRMLTGARCVDTGSYLSIDSVFSGEDFSFSFIMPASGCTISSSGFSWVSFDTRFEPCFEQRADTIYNNFYLTKECKWQNAVTTKLTTIDISDYPAASYSVIGGAVNTPEQTIPVREGYTFLGWYTDPNGGELMPDIARAEDDGRAYYAHWAQTVGTLAIEGGSLGLRLGSMTYWYLSGQTGSVDAIVTWTGGTQQAPATGSVVNVHVTRYEGDGPEAMRGVLIGMSLRAWGASATQELVGARCVDTGSYLSVDSVFSGEEFSFSFIMPASGCTISSSGFSWVSYDTRFEPCFEQRSDAIFNNFFISSGAQWQNAVTGKISSNGDIASYPAASYSTVGEVVSTPEQTMPVREGYTFLGWYTDPEGGDLMPDIARAEDNGRAYYAHWAKTMGTLVIEGGSLGLRLGSMANWYLSGAAGSADAIVTWTEGTEHAPAAGSVVNVHVTRYEGNGPEAMRGVLIGMSLKAWGASATQELVGARCVDTGSYLSVDSVFSGEEFSFSFIMPASGCSINSAGFSWVSYGTSFEPCFKQRTDAICNYFHLAYGCQWQNAVTEKVTITGNIADYPAASYSTIGESVSTPVQTIPIRDGYTFLGWYTEPDGGDLMPSVARAEDDGRSYYAHWGNADSHFYYLNIYDNIPGSNELIRRTNSTEYAFALGSDLFARAGYTLTSWNTAADGTGTAYDIGQSYYVGQGESIALYAQWTLDAYSISYALAGGSWPTSVVAVHPASFDYETPTFTVSDPVRTGYDFAGWTGTGLSGATKGLTIAQGSIDDKQFARAYTATWTPRTYKMSFDLAFDDGSASWKDGEAPATGAYDAIVYDAPVTFPKAPVRAGWIFTSWVRTDEAGAASYGAEQTVDPANFESTQDAIASFEAHWVRNLKATVPVGAGTAELSLTADWDADEFTVEEGTSSLVNLSDGALEVVSIEEDGSDEAALEARKANAREAFSARTSDTSALDAMLQGVSLLVQPVANGVKRGEVASFPLFGSYALAKGDWVLPASTDPVNGTAGSTLELAFGMDVDRDLISTLDLKIGLQHKTVSSLVYTVALVDKTEPTYSVGA